MRITNSKDGQAVLNASAMRPGQGVSGTVTDRQRRRRARAVRRPPTGVQDVPGENGGHAVPARRAGAVRRHERPAPKTVFAGRPAEFGQVVLGTIAPGAHREYLVAMTLPDSADNRFQGSSLSLGFEWLAQARAGRDGDAQPAHRAGGLRRR